MENFRWICAALPHPCLSPLLPSDGAASPHPLRGEIVYNSKNKKTLLDIYESTWRISD